MKVTLPFWYLWFVLSLMLCASFSDAIPLIEIVLSWSLRCVFIFFLFTATHACWTLSTTLQKATQEGLFDELVAVVDRLHTTMERQMAHNIQPLGPPAAPAPAPAPVPVPAPAPAPAPFPAPALAPAAHNSTDSDTGDSMDSDGEQGLHED